MDMQRIEITYYWNNDPETFWDATAAVGEYDGKSNDDDIFYWFAPGEEIVTDHGEFTVVSVGARLDAPTGSAAALTDGLAIAIEALEEFYGSDESETLTHLRNILATHGVRKGD